MMSDEELGKALKEQGSLVKLQFSLVSVESVIVLFLLFASFVTFGGIGLLRQWYSVHEGAKLCRSIALEAGSTVTATATFEACMKELER
jgi:hypothetical protein